MNNLVINQKDLAAKLRSGSAALLPTDTLPALAALPEYSAQLWVLKNRPINKPLILMGSNEEELFNLVESDCLEDASKMADLYWPGPLTLVLPASGPILKALNPNGKTIGLRVPACQIIKDLIRETGPIATTSANIAGFVSANSVKEAAIYFPNLPILGPLPWPDFSGMASTLILWQGKGNWKIIRKGALLPNEIE